VVFADWAHVAFIAIFLAIAIHIVRSRDDSHTMWLRLGLLVTLSAVVVASLVGSGVD
jgi:hypothetical protein